MISRAFLFISYLIRSQSIQRLSQKNTFFYELERYLSAARKELIAVEALRKSLIQDSRLIKTKSVASIALDSAEISVSSIARKSSSSSGDREMLYALSNLYGFKTIIELGTSLGLSTAVLALSQCNAKIISIEGNPEIASLARENLSKLKLKNVEIINSLFDQVLPTIITQIESPFLIFIDGNHTYEATLRYYKLFESVAHPKCILVFHDIYWSSEMQQAWKEICNFSGKKLCIDMFRLGIVVFDENIQHTNISVQHWQSLL